MSSRKLVWILLVAVLLLSTLFVQVNAADDDDDDGDDDDGDSRRTRQSATTPSILKQFSNNFKDAAKDSAKDFAKGAAKDAAKTTFSNFANNVFSGASKNVIPDFAGKEALQSSTDVAAVPDNLDYNAANSVTQGRLAAAAAAKFQDCVLGVGPLASLRAGCQLLDNGLRFGKTVVAVTGLTFPDCGFKCIEGTVDLQAWFGANVQPFKLRLGYKDGGISVTILIDPAVTITLQTFFDRLLNFDSEFGDLLSAAIRKLELDKVGMRVQEFVVNVKPVGLRLSGSAFLGLMEFNFHALVARVGGRVVAGVDMQVPGTHVNTMINNVLGPLANTINIFELVSMDLSLSTGKLELHKYPQLGWEGARVLPKGLALVMRTRFNAASKNSLIKMLATVMKGEWLTSLELDGAKMKLALSLPDIVLSSKISLTKIGFFMVGAIKPPKLSFGIQAGLQIKIDNEPLLFTASVEAQLVDPSVTLRLTMEGSWYRAFGIPKLAVGDVIGELTLTAREPWFGALELGGTLSIGEIEDPERITGKVYFRVDIQTPTSNYFFGQVTRITVGSLLRIIFGVNKVPAFIAETGFPKGALLSYSLMGTTTLAGDAVPMGFRLKGEANFLNFVVDADIVVAPTHLKFYLECSPIKLGPLQLSRSATEISKGPLVHIEGSVTPLMAKAHIEGYINLLMFQSYVKIILDDSHMEFTVETTWFRLLESTISVKASYGKSIKDASFSFLASLQTSKLREGVVQAAREFKQTASRKIDEAISAVKRGGSSAKNKIDDVLNCKNGCGYKCKSLMELSSEERESMGFFIEQKSHAEFDISLEEYERAMEFQRAQELAKLDEQQLIEIGVMLSNEEAAEVEQEMLMEEMSQAEGQQRVLLEEMAASYMHLDVEMGSAVELNQRFWKKLVSGARSLGSRGVSGLRSFGSRAVSGAKKFGSRAFSGAKKFGSQAFSGIKNGINSGLNAGCEVSKKLCLKGCDGLKTVSKGAVDLGTKLATETMKFANDAVAGLTKVIDDIFTSFDLKIMVAGALDPNQFNFNAEFSFRFGSLNKSFKITVNFKISTIRDLVDTVWQSVKRAILAKVPALNKFI